MIIVLCAKQNFNWSIPFWIQNSCIIENFEFINFSYKFVWFLLFNNTFSLISFYFTFKTWATSSIFSAWPFFFFLEYRLSFWWYQLSKTNTHTYKKSKREKCAQTKGRKRIHLEFVARFWMYTAQKTHSIAKYYRGWVRAIRPQSLTFTHHS